VTKSSAFSTRREVGAETMRSRSRSLMVKTLLSKEKTPIIPVIFLL